jgi:hypothetical protein
MTQIHDEPRPHDRRRQGHFAAGEQVQLGEARRAWELILPKVENYGDGGPRFGYAGVVPDSDLQRADRLAGIILDLLEECPPVDPLGALEWGRDRALRIGAVLLDVAYKLTPDEINRLLSPSNPEAAADVVDAIDAVLNRSELTSLFSMHQD